MVASFILASLLSQTVFAAECPTIISSEYVLQRSAQSTSFFPGRNSGKDLVAQGEPSNTQPYSTVYLFGPWKNPRRIIFGRRPKEKFSGKDVRSVLLSPSGKILAAVNRSGEGVLYDVEKKKIFFDFVGPRWAVQFDEKENRLLFNNGGYGEVHVIDGIGCRSPFFIALDKTENFKDRGAAISRDGKFVLAGRNNLETGGPLQTTVFEVDSKRPVLSFFHAEDQQVFDTVLVERPGPPEFAVVRAPGVPGGSIDPSEPTIFTVNSNQIHSLEFPTFYDPIKLGTATQESVEMAEALWRATLGITMPWIVSDDRTALNRPRSVAVSPDGNLLITGDDVSMLHFYDIRRGHYKAVSLYYNPDRPTYEDAQKRVGQTLTTPYWIAREVGINRIRIDREGSRLYASYGNQTGFELDLQLFRKNQGF